MKIYTVHIPGGAVHAQENAVFVREGFNWMAFLFGGLWALYHRLWLIAVLLLTFNFSLIRLGEMHLFSPEGIFVFQLGFQLFIGFQANDWLRKRLERKGYIIADISVADNLLRAEQRYFDRMFPAR